MNVSEIIFFLVAGTAVGAIYFYGLWLTVKKVPYAEKKNWLLFTSFVIRMGIVLLVFYFAAQRQWQNLIACFAGFMIIRFAVVGRVKQISKKLQA